MCRLYGFFATEPTKVECTLVHAQNALMTQSAGDSSGLTHTEGWGIATFANNHPEVEKQAWAAYHGEHFKRTAAKVYARAVLAHVRRATVGTPSLENTHPFHFGAWAFAHNGTVPNFKAMKPEMMALISPELASNIQGETDSEHVFSLFLTRLEALSSGNIANAIRETVSIVEKLAQDYAPEKKLGLNLMLTNGHVFCGTRYGRTLHMIEREGVYDCEICGFPHIHHNPKHDYRAVVVASEPITQEEWSVVPDRSLWFASDQKKLEISAL